MDFEARSLQPSVKAMLLAKFREYKSDLTKLKKEVKKLASAKGGQTAHEELLESGMVDAHMGVLVEHGHSSKSFTPGSNHFFDLDDYIFDDDYSALQAHFDDINFPSGIEASVPSLPDLLQMKKIIPVNAYFSCTVGSKSKSTSLVQYISQE